MSWFNTMAAFTSLLGSPLMCIIDHSAHYGLFRISSACGRQLQGWNCLSLSSRLHMGSLSPHRAPDALPQAPALPSSRLQAGF